jgi:H+-transporting ATPase
MASPNGSDKDLEKGDENEERSRSSSSDYDDFDEYTALQKYITTYRDLKASRTDDEEAARNAEDAKKSKPWWKFWRTGSSKHATEADPGAVPDEWLSTDISQGISERDVEPHRKRFGWNEIATEKENMWLKFLSYFQGPILYGKLLLAKMCVQTCSP